MSAAGEADVAAVASVVHRLAVMVEAGTAPTSAWTYLAESPGALETVQKVAASVAGGQGVPDALLQAAESLPAAEARAWSGVAAAWLVATQVGAPVAGALTALAEALRDLDQVHRETAAALAGPTATSRLVMVLPAVGLVFGAALGFDTIGVLLGGPIGWACLTVGVGLLVAARRWNRRLLASARATDDTPGLRLDLLAVAVGGGSAFDRCLVAVENALERSGIGGAGREDGREVLDLSQRAGVPAAALLRAEAQQERRAARSEGARRAATLAVRLMLPLGLCVLPAFMVLGVVPLMVAVIDGTLAA
ncbi:type II secretion system F family protein [Salinibacterium sp. SYSU T00001]|uniref:type II secretion system F family protein n=1 Tax=Homoserinimonas sedimenticola TaxID=2986805 RepID=UPI0022360766|nr:type II secretion system F family protein [Salinibacterium sedimenticola]MCW4385167.1 type II secretion system F family protein [Salinibacterium sedimenticola]